MNHEKCAIRYIPYDYVACTNMLGNTWYPGVDHAQQPHCQPVVDFIYWHMLGYFNVQNIIQLTKKTTYREDFDEVHKVVLDGIISNIQSLLQTWKYDAINASYPTALGYYIVNYVSDNFTLQ